MSINSYCNFQAFKKTQEWADLKDGKLMLVTEDLYGKALKFCEQSFCKDEPLSKALNVDFSEDAEDIWKASFCYNMSLLMLDQSGSEVMGMRTIRIARELERFDADRLSDDKLKKLFDFMQYCDDQAHFFKHFNTDVAVHFLGLGVSEKYRGRGIGTKLVEIALEFVRNLEIDPIYVKAEGSSNFSKKIFEKLKFEKLYEQNYEDYVVNGKTVIGNTKDHKSMICYGIKLSSN